MSWIFLSVVVGIMVGLTGIAIFSLIPKTVQSYRQFQLMHTSSDFVNFSFLVIACGSMCFAVYISALRLLFMIRNFVPKGLFWLSGGVLFVTIFSFFLPRAFSYFQRWKKENKSYDLSIASLYIFVSILILSFVVLKAIFFACGFEHLIFE